MVRGLLLEYLLEHIDNFNYSIWLDPPPLEKSWKYATEVKYLLGDYTIMIVYLSMNYVILSMQLG